VVLPLSVPYPVPDAFFIAFIGNMLKPEVMEVNPRKCTPYRKIKIYF